MFGFSKIGLLAVLFASATTTPATPQDLLYQTCIKQGATSLYQELYTVLNCESEFRNIQSEIIDDKGIREDSWGVAQIHLPSHPEITKEQALDVNFAIDYTVKEFLKGNKEQWSCYKKHYGKKSN